MSMPPCGECEACKLGDERLCMPSKLYKIRWKRKQLKKKLKKLERKKEKLRRKFKRLEEKCEHPNKYKTNPMGRWPGDYCPDCGKDW